VYAATKHAVRALSEGLPARGGRRRPHHHHLSGRGAVGAAARELRSRERRASEGLVPAHGIPADAVARAIAYAIEQPADVDVNEIVLRPTVQDF